MKFNIFLLLLATFLAVGSPQETQIYPGDYFIQNIDTYKYWAKPISANDGIPLKIEQTEAAVWKIITVGKNFYIRPLSKVKLSVALVNDKFLRLKETTPNPQNLQWKINPQGSNVVIQSAADQYAYVNTDFYNKVEYLSPGSDAEAKWRLIPYAANKRIKLQ
ncbi:unnamed protein product [Rhizophagus irregularis]|uniref:Ricin B lectin domain-containing protein n=1 Tax=Rhizophagus irregularis TaxID=588596 RepID=A0A2I1HI70_9GLOM|nr:hypothetical protein RhiirA4_429799 [Rhizophagus irregularis]CAB4412836.1 unnamed protein product [Rhizophagus irregularis]